MGGDIEISGGHQIDHQKQWNRIFQKLGIPLTQVLSSQYRQAERWLDGLKAM
jgi:hypothetical protein